MAESLELTPLKVGQIIGRDADCDEEQDDSDLYLEVVEAARHLLASGEQKGLDAFDVALSRDGKRPAISIESKARPPANGVRGQETLFELWDFAARRPLVKVKGEYPLGERRDMQFSPDGRAIARGSSDATVWLWRYDSE